jgi:hypothetical protein
MAWVRVLYTVRGTIRSVVPLSTMAIGLEKLAVVPTVVLPTAIFMRETE